MLEKIRMFLGTLILAAAVLLTSCGDEIAEFPKAPKAEDTALKTLDSAAIEPEFSEIDVRYAGDLFGSYLTMYTGHVPGQQRGLPFVKIFTTRSDIENYYYSTQVTHIYARQFTLDMNSFDEEFFKENDVLALVIEEPSVYINHTAEPVEIYSDRILFKITRHQPETAPLLDTEYHLIFVAPKGSFEGAEALPIELEISEVVDTENNSAYDADYFRIYHPEFTSFIYRADSLTDSPDVIVDAIDGYDELVYFYDQYKDLYDLDREFKDNIGTLYSWDICDRYVLLTMIIPCAGSDKPEISDVFVDNLKLYVSVSADEAKDDPKACYLLLCAIERRDLLGTDLNFVYLSVE